MDVLRAELERKKRSLDDTVKLVTSTSTLNSSDTHTNKYVKRGDFERVRIERYRLEQEQEEKDKLFKAAKKVAAMESAQGKTLVTIKGTTTQTREGGEGQEEEEEEENGENNTVTVESNKPEAFNVSNEEAIRRLRQKLQPIRLFGESDKERRLRLRALELIEERTEGQRNDFMKVMHHVDNGMNLQDVAQQIGASSSTSSSAKGKAKANVLSHTNSEAEDSEAPTKAVHGDDAQDGNDREPNPKDEEVIVDMSLVKKNPHKLYPQIYHALKRVLKEWEQSLADRPEAVRRSGQGRIAAATQQTSAEYLKPLFKSLRKRDLAPDVLQAIAEITYNMQMREYLKANDAYLRLSIGNAPWPIGVTMVGIHERSGREKIFSNNVAHVLNDETSRKYIQSLKRLLTFAQTVRPPADLSQIMG